MSAQFFNEIDQESFEALQPFTHRRLFFKGGGGDTSVDDTKDAKELARIATESYASYKETFVPAENTFIEEATNYDKASRMDQASGAAASAVQTAFGEAIQSDVQQMTGAGINPDSGTFQEAINTHTNETAKAQADNVNRTQTAIQDQKVKGLQTVVAMGNGQQTEAMQGLNETAAYSSDEAIRTATNRHNASSARNYGAGMVGGAIAGATMGDEDQ